MGARDKVSESEIHGLKPEGSHILISAYPITNQIRGRIEKGRGITAEKTISLGELKRRSLFGLIKEVRRINCCELWVVVSDHNYQPYLPLLTLIAALTSARAIRVVDFEGKSYAKSRLAIICLEPIKLGLGSLFGLLALARSGLRSRQLMRRSRIDPNAVPHAPRIAYLKTNLWFGVQAGGSIGHVAGVVNGFARHGCDIEVFSADDIPMIDRNISINRVRGFRVGGLPLEANGYMFHWRFANFGLRQLAIKPSHLIYQRNCLANFAGVEISRRFNVPLVLEYNGSEVWVSRHWGTPLRFQPIAKLVEEVNLRHAHLIIVVSQVLKEELLQRGVLEHRILFYPNCVDPELFDPKRFSKEDNEHLREKWHIPSNAIVCTFVGTFGPWHGAEVLAGAIRELSEKRLQWLREHQIRFVLVGDGQQMPKVREILKAVPEDVYVLTGLIPQSDAPSYLAASDILVSPHVPNADGSRFFGSPTKLFEYMTMEKPIIASELEQIGEVLRGAWHIGQQGKPTAAGLKGTPALLITPGSSADLISAIDFLVSNPDSRPLLGKAARELVLERFTWQKQVSAVLRRVQTMAED